MTPNPDDPLFRVLIDNYNKAGIRSVPVESTHERNVLDNLDYDIPCASDSHPNGSNGHTGPAAYLGTAPCGDQMFLCASSVELFKGDLERGHYRNSWCFGGIRSHQHPMTGFAFTPLPESGR